MFALLKQRVKLQGSGSDAGHEQGTADAAVATACNTVPDHDMHPSWTDWAALRGEVS